MKNITLEEKIKACLVLMAFEGIPVHVDDEITTWNGDYAYKLLGSYPVSKAMRYFPQYNLTIALNLVYS